MTTTSRHRLLRACAIFGLPLRPARQQPAPPTHAAAARRLHQRLRPGGVALITGPSGSGKTSLLRTLRLLLDAPPRAHARPHWAVLCDARPLAREPRRALDLLRTPRVEDALALLADAGLAEPVLLARPARTLSEGQRWRLALAIALDRARIRWDRSGWDRSGSGGPGWDRSRDQSALHNCNTQPPTITILCDEFAATLDDDTGEGVARTLVRIVRRSGGISLGETGPSRPRGTGVPPVSPASTPPRGTGVPPVSTPSPASLRLIVASGHQRVADWLNADLTVELDARA